MGTLARNELIQIPQNCESTQSFWNTSLVIRLWNTKKKKEKKNSYTFKTD